MGRHLHQVQIQPDILNSKATSSKAGMIIAINLYQFISNLQNSIQVDIEYVIIVESYEVG